MVESSKSGERIFDRLPPWMPSEEGGGNYNLLDVVGKEVDVVEGDIETLDSATTIQDAESIEQVEEIAKLISVNHKDGETLEKYRARVSAEFRSVTNEGGVNELIESSAAILNIQPSTVDYKELSENGVVKLTFPRRALNTSKLTASELADIFSNHIAAGYRLESGVGGTFTFRTSSDGDDSTLGYDGLDNNGDPKNNGGTYAGLL
jgi:DNA polymerase II large subunit